MRTNSSKLDSSLVDFQEQDWLYILPSPTFPHSTSFPSLSFSTQQSRLPSLNPEFVTEPTRYASPQTYSSKKFDAVPELAPQQTDRTDLEELLSS